MDYHDKFQKLNLSDDFLFGKVMQDEEILKILLEKVLGFAIKKVVLVQPQRVIEIDPEAHVIRLDVYDDDEVGSRYAVEMQQENKYNVPEALPVSLIRRAGLIQKLPGFSQNAIFQLKEVVIILA